ncbi:MAG: cytochrome c3 family protein [Byssovorax sp.]
MAPKKAHVGLYRNWISYAGGLTAVSGLLLIAFALLLELSIKSPSPYIGIFTFVLFPAVIVVGIIVFLIGMRVEAKRRVKVGATEALPYPAVDLNDPVHRRRFSYAIVVGSLLFVVFAFTGYNGFLMTESVEFCGSTCHVMEPERVAYQHSSHARVRCVECHVGQGAGWYVHSKLSGARQLFAVMFNTYERPIPTPVENLRPAKETCQECHWPQKFVQAQLYQRGHYKYDEKNTPEQITLLVKTGGGGENGGGIHWHMFIDNKVEYVAEDRHLQEIPWTKATRADGTTIEYWRTDRKMTPEQVAPLKHHEMDCMDCHNRPAHSMEPPDLAVDRAMQAGKMSTTLPFMKAIGVEAVSRPYATREAAHTGIPAEVKRFYAEKYPDVALASAKDIEIAGESLVGVYDRNVFPEMKVSWDTYPSNIGHRYWPGCFRCHDGKHVSNDGHVLSNDCGLCHSDPKRGAQTKMGEFTVKEEKEWHPWEAPQKHLEVKQHANVLCSDCHLAGRKPKTDCKDCHH